MSGIAQCGVEELMWARVEGTAWGQMAFGDILQQQERSEQSSAHWSSVVYPGSLYQMFLL